MGGGRGAGHAQQSSKSCESAAMKRVKATRTAMTKPATQDMVQRRRSAWR